MVTNNKNLECQAEIQLSIYYPSENNSILQSTIVNKTN